MPNIVDLRKKTLNKSYESYSTFYEIDNKALQTWNRCAIFFNIASDLSLKDAVEYAKQFDENDRCLINGLFKFIEEKGYEYVKGLVIRNELNVTEGSFIIDARQCVQKERV